MKVPAWDPGSILISATVTGKSLVMSQPSAIRISLRRFKEASKICIDIVGSGHILRAAKKSTKTLK